MIDCPYHGDQVAVADEDGDASCRRCWYLVWLIVCLTYYSRRAEV